MRNGAVDRTKARSRRLKRFQEDVREVQTNFECGVQIEGFDSFEEGDVDRVLPHRARDVAKREAQQTPAAAARPIAD